MSNTVGQPGLLPVYTSCLCTHKQKQPETSTCKGCALVIFSGPIAIGQWLDQDTLSAFAAYQQHLGAEHLACAVH